MEETSPMFYQIRLFEKGKIEIFQYVFWHKHYVVDGRSVITIKWGEDGYCRHTVSSRYLTNYYKTETIDDPIYMPYADHPQNIEVIIH